ncbi:TIGR02466 family protein [Sphingomonas adhaesiva]|uniref:TIGR02466 family protein n=1 Tax=Sphingomonas adhaesiva TaxID=28212 RepID=UPI002FFC5A88
MPTRPLFPTMFYDAAIDAPDLLADLHDSCLSLAAGDAAGRRWSRENGYRGYTSYASLDDLPLRDPAFADLKRHLDRHVAAFARDVGMDLAGKRLRLDSLWVNVMKSGGTHSGHLHPHSTVSGTFYVAVPPGSGALKLEDPRLPMMMAAPQRDGTFVYMKPHPGTVFLWESWLRHEVMPSAAKDARISISFNYRW